MTDRFPSGASPIGSAGNDGTDVQAWDVISRPPVPGVGHPVWIRNCLNRERVLTPGWKPF